MQLENALQAVALHHKTGSQCHIALVWGLQPAHLSVVLEIAWITMLQSRLNVLGA